MDDILCSPAPATSTPENPGINTRTIRFLLKDKNYQLEMMRGIEELSTRMEEWAGMRTASRVRMWISGSGSSRGPDLEGEVAGERP